jgi:lipopolysaccharide transport system ATP-binding protein
MENNAVITFDHVSKKFCKTIKRSMLYGIEDIGRNVLGFSSHAENLRKDEFWAVDDVSFEVMQGETFGIIGPNGSGKSTLLKMLNGIFWPDKGKITVNGNVGALIEVGAGFHPLLTGRENIYINAAILGMSKKEVDGKLEDIIKFADIGDFIDSPVKFYSSGMYVRLGFAVAIHCEPDILLVDEVLSVGDMNFQEKCLNQIKRLQEQQKTVIFVSHNLIAVESICSKAIYLHNGILKQYGDTKGVIQKYSTEVSHLQIDQTRTSPLHSLNTGPVKIINIELKNSRERAKKDFSTYEEMQIHIKYYAEIPVKKPSFAVIVNDLRGNRIFVSHTKIMECSPQYIKGEGVATCTIQKLPLVQGAYSIDVYINDESNLITYDSSINTISFTVTFLDNVNKLVRMSGNMGSVLVPTEWRYE